MVKVCLEFCKIVGQFASKHGVCKSAKIFGVNKGKAKYWKQKHEQPTFHPSSHGGLHNPVWDQETKIALEAIVWTLISENPFLGLKDLQKKIFTLRGQRVSKAWLSKLFKRWKWSLKKPDWKQIQKYTPENIDYYLNFVLWIQTLPSWTNIKTFDEAHFRSRDMRKKRGRGPVGKAVVGTSDWTAEENYSLLLLTSISDEDCPLTTSLLPHNVTAWDVLDFFTDCLETGKLVAGDILLLDNARVHTCRDMLPMLVGLLDQFGVTLKFFPKYSPELNPCEFVFSVIKKKIRSSLSDHPLWFQIFKRVNKFSVSVLRNQYMNCWYYQINQI
jgi:transposase